MLNMLDEYDHTKPMWLAAWNLERTLPPWVKVDKHPKTKDKKSYYYAPGSDSWVVSNAVLKSFAENLEDFIQM